MKDNFLKNLEKNNKVFVFVSPHFDDAVLSCGSWIDRLVKNGKKVVVVNIFTKAHVGPYTLSAKKYLKECGYVNAIELHKEREKEDKLALEMLGVEVINLEFKDALFRQKNDKSLLGRLVPEFSHVYPTYRMHVIKDTYKNDPIKAVVSEELKKIIPSRAVVVSPFGIGGHADHVLARAACEDAFGRVVYYSDFPYNLRSEKEEVLGFERFYLDVDLSRKENVLRKYKTQYSLLFADRVLPKHKEEVFIKNE